MKRRHVARLSIAALVTAGALAATAAEAAPPPTVTHQGRLYDGDDHPVNGDLQVSFAMFDGATSGARVWSEKHTVTFDDGYFAVELGAATPFAHAFDAGALFLEITIRDDAPLSPRAPVRSVPFALVSRDAVGDIHPTSIVVGGQTIVDGTGKWVGPASGLAGATGATGPRGATGTTGAQGPAATNGLQGPQGPMGPAGPQGSIGVAGVQGPAGPVGAQGAVGPTGATGPNGIVSGGAFSGYAGGTITLDGNAGDYKFLGPWAVVFTDATQRLIAAGEAPIALGSGELASVRVGLCYQPVAGGAILNFFGPHYTIAEISTQRIPIAGIATVVPGAGSWKVGMCAINDGPDPQVLSDNDFVNGWVEVTN